MNFTLHLPNNYARQPLPGLDEITSDLRANPDKQTHSVLGIPEGPNCCLGRVCLLQGRLDALGCDQAKSDRTPAKSSMLSHSNPYAKVFGTAGDFPAGVRVELTTDDGYQGETALCLTECNDFGLTFPQIATIIESVWFNSGPILK